MLLVHAMWWSGCDGQVCTEEEQAVFAEFPQSGGLRVVPKGTADTATCAAYYQTADPPSQVQQYFVDALRACGWTIEQSWTWLKASQLAATW